jgi:hypothetical protein
MWGESVRRDEVGETMWGESVRHDELGCHGSRRGHNDEWRGFLCGHSERRGFGRPRRALSRSPWRKARKETMWGESVEGRVCDVVI